MAKNSNGKRLRALEKDPFVYQKDAPMGCIEASDFERAPFESEITIVGRIMLSDPLTKKSRLGVFEAVDGVDAIVLERLEGNGCSVAAFLVRNQDNIDVVNSLIHYGDVVALCGVKKKYLGTSIFFANRISLLSKATGDVYDSNIDFRKKSNVSEYRYLQLIRDPKMVLHFRRCSTIFRVLRQFLYARGYEELNMGLLQNSFEAGLADPFVTRSVDQTGDMYLRLTSEILLRKLMVGGLSRVFEIGKSFRNQGATSSTLPHFTILELYRAYASREEMEGLIKDLLCEILRELYGSASLPVADGVIDCSGSWTVCDYAEEIERLTGFRYDESRPVEELAVLLDAIGIPRPAKVNRYTVSTSLYAHIVSGITTPTFLRGLPAAQSPLFKGNGDGSTVDETLLVINGMLVADIVNPERDPVIIRRSMEEQAKYGKAEQGHVNESIIRAMEFGLPPCRGIGMGIERLLMLLLNARDIRDVELFPVF